MRITWVTRSFLDYRIPVFKALNELCGNQLTLIYYKDVVPERVRKKAESILGDRAIARDIEFRIGNRPKVDNAVKTGLAVRVPLSPGLIKKVIDTKPDAIVSDGFMQWTYAALAVRAIKYIPHVMCYERTAHVERNAQKARIWYRKFVSRWIDAIDCNGSLCEEYVTNALGFDPKRITFGHMAAETSGLQMKCSAITDAEVESFRGKNGIKGIMLLFVGRLYELKGVMELLKGWQSFMKQCPDADATLAYVGGGDQEQELREYISAHKIPNVVMTGAIDYDDIALYYRAADCFIIATKGDNWSLVVPEAMACGLPIATSIYNGCWPELVTSANGWTFDPLNQESIVSVLHQIVEHKKELKAMGAESRRIVASYTPENAAQSIYNAIDIAKKHLGL